jgi:hypothetical protein
MSSLRWLQSVAPLLYRQIPFERIIANKVPAEIPPHNLIFFPLSFRGRVGTTHDIINFKNNVIEI